LGGAAILERAGKRAPRGGAAPRGRPFRARARNFFFSFTLKRGGGGPGLRGGAGPSGFFSASSGQNQIHGGGAVVRARGFFGGPRARGKKRGGGLCNFCKVRKTHKGGGPRPPAPRGGPGGGKGERSFHRGGGCSSPANRARPPAGAFPWGSGFSGGGRGGKPALFQGAARGGFSGAGGEGGNGPGGKPRGGGGGGGGEHGGGAGGAGRKGPGRGGGTPFPARLRGFEPRGRFSPPGGGPA